MFTWLSKPAATKLQVAWAKLSLSGRTCAPATCFGGRELWALTHLSSCAFPPLSVDAHLPELGTQAWVPQGSGNGIPVKVCCMPLAKGFALQASPDHGGVRWQDAVVAVGYTKDWLSLTLELLIYASWPLSCWNVHQAFWLHFQISDWASQSAGLTLIAADHLLALTPTRPICCKCSRPPAREGPRHWM